MIHNLWMSEQFDFGSGLVNAHRHVNGGGWVADTATVELTAFVGDKALVYGKAQVCDKAQVCGEAQVYGEARVYDKAQVCGKAQVYGEARVCGAARVSPLNITGFEFPVTAADSTCMVGCKPFTAETLRIGAFPEERCPRLREAAPELIVAVLAHWKRCAR